MNRAAWKIKPVCYYVENRCFVTYIFLTLLKTNECSKDVAKYNVLRFISAPYFNTHVSSFSSEEKQNGQVRARLVPWGLRHENYFEIVRDLYEFCHFFLHTSPSYFISKKPKLNTFSFIFVTKTVSIHIICLMHRVKSFIFLRHCKVTSIFIWYTFQVDPLSHPWENWSWRTDVQQSDLMWVHFYLVSELRNHKNNKNCATRIAN